MGGIFSRSVGLDGDRSATFTIRLAVAVVQAVALYLLTDSAVQPTQWPATDLEVYAPLRFVFQYIPILVLFGLGQISARPLVVWVTLATLIIAVLGYHDAARGRFIANYIGEGHFAPWPPVWLGLATVLFVANVLVVELDHPAQAIPALHSAFRHGLEAGHPGGPQRHIRRYLLGRAPSWRRPLQVSRYRFPVAADFIISGSAIQRPPSRSQRRSISPTCKRR